MTPNCIKQIEKLEDECNATVGDKFLFTDLSAEQLLYAAIKGVGFDDVKYVLENTDWDKYLKGK